MVLFSNTLLPDIVFMDFEGELDLSSKVWKELKLIWFTHKALPPGKCQE